MSHTYHLLCRECLSVLDLGKIVNLDGNGQPLPWMFGGWIDQKTGVRLQEVELWRLVERFLIVHRNHPLQVVSEAYVTQEDPMDAWHNFESAAEVLSLEPDPLPDDYRDAAEVTARSKRSG
jgi:hypothetical protein